MMLMMTLSVMAMAAVKDIEAEFVDVLDFFDITTAAAFNDSIALESGITD